MQRYDPIQETKVKHYNMPLLATLLGALLVTLVNCGQGDQFEGTAETQAADSVVIELAGRYSTGVAGCSLSKTG